jgi:phosphoribosylaminoimidazole-succinocarboxamide synthase
MISDDLLHSALPHTNRETNFTSFGKKIRGKVRDCFVVNDKRILVSSDRLSAFDVVLTSIPFKGQILNDLASYWFKKTSPIIPNHVISRPHPNVFIGHELKIIPIEVIVRGHLSGSAWRDYDSGLAISGLRLPSGMKKYDKFPTPIITPSTKEESGNHDRPISKEEILKSGIVSEDLWIQVEESALQLFNFASQEVSSRGLLLFDTKYEFGLLEMEDGTQELYLADEIHTQDCSRFCVMDTFEKRISEGKKPEMLDKEFIREWLMEKGYMGEGTPPEFPDSFRVEIAKTYIKAFELITGDLFLPFDEPIDEKILHTALSEL